MKLHSEKEIIEQNLIDLENCSLLERDGVVTLDELSTLIPGYIHLNNRKNICKKLETGKLIDLVKFVQVFLNK